MADSDKLMKSVSNNVGTDDHRRATQQKLTTFEGRPFFAQYCAKYDISKPPKKKSFVVQDVVPSGDDHGKGPRVLLKGYVNEVLNHENIKEGVKADPAVIKSFDASSFVEQSKHQFLEAVPLKSQLAYKNSLVMHHTTEKRKEMVDLYNQLLRSDGCLVRIRLNSESIDDDILVYLCKALEKNIYLQHMMLHDNFITDIGVDVLCMALRWHPQVHTIWLAANFLSDKSAVNLATLLRRNQHIKELNLANKWPRETWSKAIEEGHPRITQIGAISLAKQLSNGSSLTSLSLADQRICDEGANALFGALKPSILRVLNVSANILTDACALALKHALVSQPALEKLDLSKNHFTDAACSHLGAGIAINGVLQALNLSENKIGDDGMDILAAALDRNLSLSSLAIVYNPCDAHFSELLERIIAGRGTYLRTGSAESALRGASARPKTQQQLQLDSRSSTGQLDLAGMSLNSNLSQNDEVRSLSGSRGNVGVRGKRPFSRSYVPPNSRERENLLRSIESDACTGIDRLSSAGLSTSSQLTIETISEDNEEEMFSQLFAPSNSLVKALPMDPLSLPPVESHMPISQPLHDMVKHNRRTKDIGRILGVPDLGHMGIMPVRSAASRYRDNGQHSLYLRVLTPLDPPGTEPLSVLQVVLDNKAERERIIQERDNKRYRDRKRDRLTWKPRDGLQRAALKPPPEKFWKQWSKTMQKFYPEGIDKASGCTSTKVEVKKKGDVHAKYEVMFDSSTGKFISSSEDAASILAAKRHRTKLQKSVNSN